MAENEIQIFSNVKIITTGNKPTADSLQPGQAAFGKIDEDGKYHLFGNSEGEVVDIVLDTMDGTNETETFTPGGSSQNATSLPTGKHKYIMSGDGYIRLTTFDEGDSKYGTKLDFRVSKDTIVDYAYEYTDNKNQIGYFLIYPADQVTIIAVSFVLYPSANSDIKPTIFSTDLTSSKLEGYKNFFNKIFMSDDAYTDIDFGNASTDYSQLANKVIMFNGGKVKLGEQLTSITKKERSISTYGPDYDIVDPTSILPFKIKTAGTSSNKTVIEDSGIYFISVPSADENWLKLFDGPSIKLFAEDCILAAIKSVNTGVANWDYLVFSSKMLDDIKQNIAEITNNIESLSARVTALESKDTI